MKFTTQLNSTVRLLNRLEDCYQQTRTPASPALMISPIQLCTGKEYVPLSKVSPRKGTKLVRHSVPQQPVRLKHPRLQSRPPTEYTVLERTPFGYVYSARSYCRSATLQRKSPRKRPRRTAVKRGVGGVLGQTITSIQTLASKEVRVARRSSLPALTVFLPECPS